MEHHGSESYFVLGEGLLTESVGGRDRTLAAAAEAMTPPFRFSRMGPNGVNRQLGDPNRKKIGSAMTAGGGGASGIPAGFTYLGQFVDHDLTFDKTNVMLGENVSPIAAPAGALAEPRPRLALRRRTVGPRVGQVLRARRTPSEDGEGGRGRRNPGQAGLRPAPWRRRDGGGEAEGDHPGPAERREPGRRPDAPRVHPLPQPGRRHAARLGSGGSALREGAARRSSSTTSGCSGRTTSRGSARPESSTTSSTRAGRPSRSASRRPRCRRCRSSSPSPRSGSGTR